MTLMENSKETFYKKGEDTAAGIVFADAVTGFADAQRPGCVLHILCLHGGMSFMLHDVRYNVAPQDYVILPNAALASDFTGASDVEAIVMSLSETLVASLALRSNYGIIGHLSLLQNPVMRLSADDFAVCRESLLGLRRRIEDSAAHLFRSEMLAHLLMAHILDLYDIHARDALGLMFPSVRSSCSAGSSVCFMAVNMLPTAILSTTPRVSASRRITSRRCAARPAESLRRTGLTALQSTE